MKRQTIYKQKKKKHFLVKEGITSTLAYQTIINSQIQHIKKDYGIFFTPEQIVDFMISQIDINRLTNKKEVNILEPACGLAQFLIGIKRNFPVIYKQAQITGVEINENIIKYLNRLKLDNNINLIHSDYLLWQPKQKYDLIIGNPPYGIPSPSEHYTIKINNTIKEKYKNIFETWYGKYNVYGAFIEKSIKLLNSDGQMIFIVPATFMILDEFKKLRHFLSKNGKTIIIYMGPEIFKPEADITSVVIVFHKSEKLTHNLILLEYTRLPKRSGGQEENKSYPIKVNRNWQGEVITFETEHTKSLESMCSYSLGNVYEIKISPRTPEIKHNTNVIKEDKENDNNYLPILNGRNLKCNRIIYKNLTGYWIKKTKLNKFRGYSNIPHIVIGLGFRENGKIGAAYDEKCYPWMGDVYHIFKKYDLFNTGFDLSDPEVTEYLNSEYVRKYIKDTYREITYHLSITQLKNIPLPTKSEWNKIKNGGIL
ncbi:MAG: TaqI-like C-terminal specificity domain-containing protein [Endomicrobiia bacterium]